MYATDTGTVQPSIRWHSLRTGLYETETPKPGRTIWAQGIRPLARKGQQYHKHSGPTKQNHRPTNAYIIGNRPDTCTSRAVLVDVSGAFSLDSMTLTYTWMPDLPSRANNAIAPRSDQDYTKSRNTKRYATKNQAEHEIGGFSDEYLPTQSADTDHPTLAVQGQPPAVQSRLQCLKERHTNPVHNHINNGLC